MSCDITKGRKEPCKDSVGGLYDVYFINYDDPTTGTKVGIVTDADGVVTDINNGDTVPASTTAYKWKVKGASSLEETVNSARDMGTTFWTQALNLTFKRLDSTTRKEIKLISWGRPYVVVMDNNGNAMMCGIEDGMEVTGGTIVTGTAKGDLSGYTLVLTGEEREPANFLQGATKNDPFAGMTTTMTVVTSEEDAVYALGSGAACTNGADFGTFTAGTPLEASNYIEAEVTVTQTGSYNIDTDTINGYRFAGQGTFLATGTQVIKLYGYGTPTSAQTDSFTLSSNDLGGTGNCTHDITVS